MGVYDFLQARRKVSGAVGHDLSDTEVDSAFKQFGGSRTDTFDDAGLAPVIDYFKKQPAVATPPPTGSGPGVSYGNDNAAGGTLAGDVRSDGWTPPRTVGGGTAAGLPAPSTSGISYDVALGGANKYAQQYWGRTLTEADIAKMKAQLGFAPGALIDAKGQQAIVDYIKGSATGGAPPKPPPSGGDLTKPPLGPTEFDDPAGSLLERLARDRIERLGQTPNRPNLDIYGAALQDKERVNQERAGQFAGTLRARAEELKGPAFSQGDEAALRAGAFDALERRRAETLKNKREDIYARGFAPTSGLAVDSDNKVNEQFEGTRGQIESDLLRSMIQESQRRKDQAVNLEGVAQQALAGGDSTSLGYLSQIADLEDRLIMDTDSKDRERIQTAGIPIDLANQRTQQALQILGGGGNPQSIMQSLLGLMGLDNQSRSLDIANRNNNMSGLGLLSSFLLSALK